MASFLAAKDLMVYLLGLSPIKTPLLPTWTPKNKSVHQSIFKEEDFEDDFSISSKDG
jgi:hypothetical protein